MNKGQERRELVLWRLERQLAGLKKQVQIDGHNFQKQDMDRIEREIRSLKTKLGIEA
jgi:hypothetical protein